MSSGELVDAPYVYNPLMSTLLQCPFQSLDSDYPAVLSPYYS